MCFARTAALQGGFEKQKVNASKGFLQQSMRHVQKSFESYGKNMFCRHVRHVPKSIKHRKNCGFVARGACLWCVLADVKNHRQMWLWRLQNLAQTTQNRVRSDHKLEKNDQHEFKKCKKRLRTGQERRKAAQERKMCQHGPNMARSDLEFGRSWPPPSKDMQYVNAGIKCSRI